LPARLRVLCPYSEAYRDRTLILSVGMEKFATEAQKHSEIQLPHAMLRLAAMLPYFAGSPRLCVLYVFPLPQANSHIRVVIFHHAAP